MFKWLFRAPPKIGSVWEMCPGGDPFDSWQVTVVDVKGGWVKYTTHRGIVLTNPIRAFRSIYKEVK